jgi:uncharacterized protein YjgD (DUF1641 family)
MKITKSQLKQIIKEEIEESAYTRMDPDRQLRDIMSHLNKAGIHLHQAIDQAKFSARNDPQIKVSVIQFLEDALSKARAAMPDESSDELEPDL